MSKGSLVNGSCFWALTKDLSGNRRDKNNVRKIGLENGHDPCMDRTEQNKSMVWQNWVGLNRSLGCLGLIPHWAFHGQYSSFFVVSFVSSQWLWCRFYAIGIYVIGICPSLFVYIFGSDCINMWWPQFLGEKVCSGGLQCTLWNCKKEIKRKKQTVEFYNHTKTKDNLSWKNGLTLIMNEGALGHFERGWGGGGAGF